MGLLQLSIHLLLILILVLFQNCARKNFSGMPSAKSSASTSPDGNFSQSERGGEEKEGYAQQEDKEQFSDNEVCSGCADNDRRDDDYADWGQGFEDLADSFGDKLGDYGNGPSGSRVEVPVFQGDCDQKRAKLLAYVANSMPPLCNLSVCKSVYDKVSGTFIGIDATEVSQLFGNQVLASIDRLGKFQATSTVLQADSAADVRATQLNAVVGSVDLIGGTSVLIDAKRIHQFARSTSSCVFSDSFGKIDNGYTSAFFSSRIPGQKATIDVLDLRNTNTTKLRDIHVKKIIDSKEFPRMRNRVFGTFTYDTIEVK